MKLLPVAILAGGLATRLQSMSEKTPKALIDINGEPFIAHQLRLLKKQKIEKIVLCLGHLGKKIEQFVKDGSQFGLSVEYSYDGEQLLGTGGALKKALPLLSQDFFVLYGDSYLSCDYQEIQQTYLDNKKKGLMTVFKNEGQWDNSNIEYKEGLLINYDKITPTTAMQYIDYGLGVLSKNALDTVSFNKATDLACVYQYLLKNKQLAAYEVKKRFYEIGSFKGINDLSAHLSKELESLT